MKFHPNSCYHIYNQGNNRDKIFYEADNYLFFLTKLHGLNSHNFHIIAYCLMPNHFHLMTFIGDMKEEEKESKTFSLKIGTLLSSYTKAFNKRYGRTGSLFRSETKAKLLNDKNSTDSYLASCFHYIHQNPLKAKIVEQMMDWPYSSYRDYSGVRNGKLVNIERGKKIIGFSNSDEFIKQSKRTLDPNKIEHIF